MMVPTTTRPTPGKLKNTRFSTKIGTKTIFGAANPKMIVPMARDKGVGEIHQP